MCLRLISTTNNHGKCICECSMYYVAHADKGLYQGNSQLTQTYHAQLQVVTNFLYFVPIGADWKEGSLGQ